MANARRLELQEIFCEILGTRNAYYNPPEDLIMQYDAIVYSLGEIDSKYANNKRYKSMRAYDVMVISRNSDPEILDKVLELPYTSLSGKPYVVDNLHHYPIKLYY